MRNPERILLTGGGTAGHVNPALAIGAAFEGARFLFVGVRGRIEEQIVPREGIPIKFVRASGYPGMRPSWTLARFLLDLAIGIGQSTFILMRFRPQVIIGTGGYASAPVMMAAYLLRKLRLVTPSVFVHEQNAIPGKLNWLMGRFADRVFVTFPETLSYFRQNGIVVGYPLRKRIVKLNQEGARAALDFVIPEGHRVVFVFGGSQGARAINQAVIAALPFLLPYKDKIFVIHGTGLKQGATDRAAITSTAQLSQFQTFYVTRPFFHEIERVYACSDLVVIRGGSGSLNEISAMGLPAIVIPKSNLPGDHQVMNARAMERAGAAEILYEDVEYVGREFVEKVDGRKLAERILALIQNESVLSAMGKKTSTFLKRNAASEIERAIRGFEVGDAVPSVPEHELAEAEAVPTNQSLLGKLEPACARAPLDYSPLEVIGDPRDLEFFKNRASALLCRSAWKERNLGVKLLGLLHAGDKLPLLLAVFNDRRPAAWIKRLFGGDFEQVGFIRRNVVTALERINQINDEVEEALLLSLKDPYYEVMAEGARVAGVFGPRLRRRKDFVRLLLGLVRDRNIEVAAAAGEALGRIGDQDDALPALLSMSEFRRWKVRAAALKGIYCLIERGVAKDFELLKNELPKFAITSTDFTPEFEIRTVYRNLMHSISKKEGRTIDN